MNVYASSFFQGFFDLDMVRWRKRIAPETNNVQNTSVWRCCLRLVSLFKQNKWEPKMQIPSISLHFMSHWSREH